MSPQHVLALKQPLLALLINNISSIHSKGSNCEVDTCSVFKSLKKIFFRKDNIPNYTVEVYFEDINCDNIIEEFEVKQANPKIRASLDYVSGYVLKKLKVNKNCDACRECLYKNYNRESTINTKEYFCNKRLLTYPSVPLIKCYSQIQDVINMILKKESKRRISETIQKLYFQLQLITIF